MAGKLDGGKRQAKTSVGSSLYVEDEALEDDADYQAAKQDEKEDRTKKPETFLLEGLGQIAPVVPVRWVDIAQEEWPYKTPKEEFIRTPFPLDLGTLIHRWQGFWTQNQIEVLYNSENWPHLRFVYQDEKDKRAFNSSLAKDASYQTRIINQDIEQMALIIERLMADFMSGFEYRPVRGAGAFAYVRMPMTVDARIKLADAVKKARQFRGVRVGLFSDMTKNDGTHELTVSEQFRQAMAETNDMYAAILKVAGLDGKFITQSQAQALEGGGRMFDALPLENAEISLDEIYAKLEERVNDGN